MSQKYQWYILKVASNKEKKVKCFLENEIQGTKYEDIVKEIHIPTEKVYTIKQGKKKIKEKNVLPGYILISADLTNLALVHTICKVNGVIGFLTSGGRYSKTMGPKAVPEKEINQILHYGDEYFDGNSDEKLKLESPFLIGEVIKVIDGPFREFTGTIDKVLEDRNKVVVIIKIFGRETPTELRYNQVEKIY